jgi:hypothetical protein
MRRQYDNNTTSIAVKTPKHTHTNTDNTDNAKTTRGERASDRFLYTAKENAPAHILTNRKKKEKNTNCPNGTSGAMRKKAAKTKNRENDCFFSSCTISRFLLRVRV